MSWTIHSQATDKSRLLVEESLFFTGNGYLGVRGNLEEDIVGINSIRGTYINGFYDNVPILYGEKMAGFPNTQQSLVNLMDAQGLQIWIDGEQFLYGEGTLLAYERVLDMQHGFHIRMIHWCTASGQEVKIHFKRLTSFVEQHLFQQEITLETLGGAVPVTVVSTLHGNILNFADPEDPRVAANQRKHLHMKELKLTDSGDYIAMNTATSNLSVAALTTIKSDHSNTVYGKELTATACITTLDFTLTNKVTLEKRTIFADSIRFQNLQHTCIQIMNNIQKKSSDDLYQEQKEYMDKFWKQSDILIEGNDQLQEILRFNLFHILQSTGKDGITNIAAKGLSGEGYEGHYFWDTEIYMLPFYILTQPHIAKKLLLYRYTILPEALKRAKEMGHQQGALFPWRTINGTECSSYFPAGSAQYHISADIAHSYIQYYLATKDLDFLVNAGVELLIETARLWIDAGHFYQGFFQIDSVTGPDEYTCIVNNNYYTNVLAQQNLRWAIKAWEIISEQKPKQAQRLGSKIHLTTDELHSFQRAADCMYLPIDQKLGINPQDDTFLQKAVWNFADTPKSHYPLLLHYHPLTIYRHQVCKQADTVLAHLLIEDAQTDEVMRNSYHYYEAITTHDSSLSSCIFGMMASRIGEQEKAYNYFCQSIRLDLDDTQGNTKDGLHLANMGGAWMGIVVGFAGMRIKENGLYFRPQLPKGWEGYEFCFHYEYSILKMAITKNYCTLTLLEGYPVHINIEGTIYKIVNVHHIRTGKE